MKIYNALFFIAFFISGAAQANDFYPISTCQDLQDIKYNVRPNLPYKLINDIDCDGFPFEPIYGTGTYGNSFKGTLDGQGFTIKNLSIAAPTEVGLFEGIFDSTITHINFSSSKLSSTASSDLSYKGLIAASASNSVLSNITVNDLSIVSNENESSNMGSTGGIIGTVWSGDITLSNINLDSVYIKLAGHEHYAGGVIGELSGKGNTLTKVNLTNLNIDAQNSYKLGPSCWNGNQLGCRGAGGLIGGVDNIGSTTITIDKSYVHGSIDALYNAGGLVGWFSDQIDQAPTSYIRDSHTNVTVDSSLYAGGIIGQAPDDNSTHVILERVYAIGDVAPGGDKGGKGLSGNKQSTSKRVLAVDSFFDKRTTGKENSGTDGGVGLGSKAMKEAKTYSNWSEAIWVIVDGEYPTLQ